MIRRLPPASGKSRWLGFLNALNLLSDSLTGLTMQIRYKLRTPIIKSRSRTVPKGTT